MLIKAITLNNFRQFKGKQKIVFSTDKDNNITIIHGENGSGKTTLLQAFLWCFYGEKNVSLTYKEMLLNKSVEMSMPLNSARDIEVTIEFEHENRKYFATRKQSILKQINGQIRKKNSDFLIDFIDEHGDYTNYNKELPENFINRIFPEKLSSYFLFDGERIKNLGDNSREGRKDLSTAVSNILGLDILIDARKHVGRVKNEFKKEQTSKFDLKTIEKINNNIDKIKNNIDIYIYQEKELLNEMEELEEDITKYSDKLKTFKQSKELQKKREEIKANIQLQEKRIEEIRELIYKSFSDKAYIFFAKQLFNDAKNILSKYDVSDSYIEGINGKAIDLVLNRKRCFCGKELTEECCEYKALMEMKKYLPPQSFGVMINSFIKESTNKSRCIENFTNEINEYNKRFLREKLKLTEFKDKLNEINKAIKNINFEAIRKTEEVYIEKVNRKDEIIKKELIDVRARIKSSIKQLENDEKKREESIIYNKKNILLKKRIDICETLQQKFELYHKEREKVVREHLESSVKEIFNKIIHKDYIIDIDEKYTFDVIDENQITVPMSEGERQVTSLSFIAGIIDIARDEEFNERLARDTGYNSKEIYPLIMDSPFGSLDSEHRKNVAKSIPKLAGQVIIFASSTQWEGEVENELKGIVGKAYILDYHKELQNNISDEYTEIKEVGE